MQDVGIAAIKNFVRNKTIIGLKYRPMRTSLTYNNVRNKTIIGLK